MTATEFNRRLFALIAEGEAAGVAKSPKVQEHFSAPTGPGAPAGYLLPHEHTVSVRCAVRPGEER